MGQSRIKKGKSLFSIHYKSESGDHGIAYVGTRREVARELKTTSVRGHTFEVRKALPGDTQRSDREEQPPLPEIALPAEGV